MVARVIFDPGYSEIDSSNFMEYEWKNFYGDFARVIPPLDAPFPHARKKF